METGKLIKSTNFHTSPYWVVKCDNLNLTGNRNGELPIDPVSFNFHPWKILPPLQKMLREEIERGDVF